MFDDPKRNLERIQRELLAAEEEYEADDDLMDVLEILRRDEKRPASRYDCNWQEDWEEPEEVVYRQPVRREKGIRGLVLLACLELLGILLIGGWWMLWIL